MLVTPMSSVIILMLLNSLSAVLCENATSVYRITPTTFEQLDVMQNINYYLNDVEFWKHPTYVNKTIDLAVREEEFEKFNALMREKELTYEVTIPDLQKLLDDAAVQSTDVKVRVLQANRFPWNNNYYMGNNFGWTRFHSLDEIYDWLDFLAFTNYGRVEVITGGRSYEGRPIKGVKLTFGYDKPRVFVEAGIHAREWLSHATATYLINQLLTSDDPEIRRLAESFEWHIFPCVNPDGYVYTHVNPRDSRYRLWRASRSPHTVQRCTAYRCYKTTCYGADLNRNWGFRWGGPGSSHRACDEIYAGSSPFSEIETKTLSQYISSVSSKLFAYISFHTYIEKIMYPYGHTKTNLDNYNQLYRVGRQAANALSRRYGTQYEVGNIASILGKPASGGSVDWVKARLNVPFVYCYELRGHTSAGSPYGFVPPPSEIIPNGQEVTDSLVALFRAASKYNYSKRNA